MYFSKTVSVILPTYAERRSIRKVINDFDNLLNDKGKKLVDEIIVVNNNAQTGTSQEVQKTRAFEVFESVQGYGSAIQTGYRVAKGDLIVVCEPDDTFLASDIYKFLSFADDVDIVYGSRTVKNFIWSGANMGRFLKWGNWFVAKLIEVLFNTNYLSDVGCTYRLVKRKTIKRMLPHFLVKSNFFGPEMIIVGYQMNLKSVQIPINYKKRVGKSSVTGDFFKAFSLGVKMILLIIVMRCGLKRIVRYL